MNFNPRLIGRLGLVSLALMSSACKRDLSLRDTTYSIFLNIDTKGGKIVLDTGAYSVKVEPGEATLTQYFDVHREYNRP